MRTIKIISMCLSGLLGLSTAWAAGTADNAPDKTAATSVKAAPGKSASADYVETAFGMTLQMVYVAGGTFEMGCTAEQGDCHDEETPVHSVTLDDYYIGKFEVTQSQWQAVMGTTMEDIIEENDWLRYGLGDDYPMYYVSWDDAVQFCEKLSALTGKTYRLPTEAEWEYAARGGQNADGTKYAGSNSIGEVAWYEGNSGKTHAVGTKAPNGLGLCDMSGNVFECCSDWYGSNYYGSSPERNPQGPSTGPGRVVRGGCWASGIADEFRLARRAHTFHSTRIEILGFRVVCESASAAARIRAISCPDADVTRLDLSRCPALADLTCSGNALTALDVSASPALTDLDCSGNRIATLRTAATFGSQGAVSVRLFDNCLPLSALAEIDGRLDASGQSGEPVARYTPQRIPVELTLGKALDLNAELKLNGVETTVDFGTAASSDYVFKNGQLRFKRVGTYAVRLRNGSVRDRGDDAVVEVFYDITVKAGGGSDEPSDPSDPGDDPDEPLTPPTANEDLTSASAASAWAYVSGRTIYVTDAVDVNSDEVSVYTTVGQRIYRGHGRAVEVPQAGVYILTAGERRMKVLVR